MTRGATKRFWPVDGAGQTRVSAPLKDSISLWGAQTLRSAGQKSDEERTNRVPRRSLIPSLVILSEGSQSLPVASIEIPRRQGNQGLGMTMQAVAATKGPVAFVVGLCLERAGVEAGLALRGTPRAGSSPGPHRRGRRCHRTGAPDFIHRRAFEIPPQRLPRAVKKMLDQRADRLRPRFGLGINGGVAVGLALLAAGDGALAREPVHDGLDRRVGERAMVGGELLAGLAAAGLG